MDKSWQIKICKDEKFLFAVFTSLPESRDAPNANLLHQIRSVLKGMSISRPHPVFSEKDSNNIKINTFSGESKFE
jgi:hypothetical protein